MKIKFLHSVYFVGCVFLFTILSTVALASDSIVVQLKWFHDAQSAGFYAAIDQGFYKKENLDVTLLPGGPKVHSVNQLVNNTAQVAVAGSHELLTRHAEGHPIVATAAIYQQNPFVYFSLESSNIETPLQFKGKRLLFYKDDPILKPMLSKFGLTTKDLITIDHGTASFDSFLAGKETDIWTGYLSDQVMHARRKGKKINVIHPEDYGISSYSEIIITTDSYLKMNPQTHTKFLKATFKGWEWAVNNPKQAAKLALKHDSQLDETHLYDTLISSIPYIKTDVPIGTMTMEKWEQTYKFQFENTSALKNDLSKAINLKFLEKIYK